MVTLFTRGRVHVLFLLLSSITTYKVVQADACEALLAETYAKLHLDKTCTPTTAYLARPELRLAVDKYYSQKMQDIGLPYFKTLFTDIFKREVAFAGQYHVFYHGQEREFILLQDLYAGLYNIAQKKQLQDFFMLRVPDKDLKKYKSVKDLVNYFFTRKKQIDNYAPGMQKLLLSVNASLFGNTYNVGSCTFDYFLTSSNCYGTNKINFIESAFKLFNYEHYFAHYKQEIEELESLLRAQEHNKTGALLQIFIPKTVINTIAYRCVAGGVQYHADGHHDATADLFDYQQHVATGMSNYALDAVQFRLLMLEAMTQPSCGVKMFRYCNTTTNVRAYQVRLKALLDGIANAEGAA